MGLWEHYKADAVYFLYLIHCLMIAIFSLITVYYYSLLLLLLNSNRQAHIYLVRPLYLNFPNILSHFRLPLHIHASLAILPTCKRR